MRLVLLLLLMSCSSMAQHSEQPTKESSSDLRNGMIMFSIEEFDSDKVYWLERTSNLDYFLRRQDDKDEQTIRKVDSRDASKLDMQFASHFLKIQYEIPAETGDCKVIYKLTMKGEAQDLCKKDEKKTQEIKPFLDVIVKRF